MWIHNTSIPETPQHAGQTVSSFYNPRKIVTHTNHTANKVSAVITETGHAGADLCLISCQRQINCANKSSNVYSTIRPTTVPRTEDFALCK